VPHGQFYPHRGVALFRGKIIIGFNFRLIQSISGQNKNIVEKWWNNITKVRLLVVSTTS
jgi:hypothetical protein